MIERRLMKHAQMRATNEGHITGHAAVFDQEYVLWDDEISRAVETVKAGAFRRALKEKHDVRALFNHEPNILLGRTKAGTLALKEDSVGLYFDIDPPGTQIARDIYTLIKRGDISGCSFAFTVTSENVTELKKAGKIVRRREIEDVDLYDVGPVTYPAYDGTDVNARAVELRSSMFPEGVPATVLRLAPSFAAEFGRRKDRPSADLDLEEMNTRMRLLGLKPVS